MPAKLQEVMFAGQQGVPVGLLTENLVDLPFHARFSVLAPDAGHLKPPEGSVDLLGPHAVIIDDAVDDLAAVSLTVENQQGTTCQKAANDDIEASPASVMLTGRNHVRPSHMRCHYETTRPGRPHHLLVGLAQSLGCDTKALAGCQQDIEVGRFGIS